MRVEDTEYAACIISSLQLNAADDLALHFKINELRTASAVLIKASTCR